MSDILLVRLAGGEGGFRDWILVDAAGHARTPARRGAPEAGVVAGAARCLVLVPAEAVLLAQARVPGRKRQRVLRALPYALEEQLASDVEELHFALGPAQEDDHYPVAVVDRQLMDAWSALLEQAGVTAHAWIPETLALPLADEGWSVLAEDERVLVRSGPYAGFGVEADALPVLLSLMRRREQLPGRAQLFGARVIDLEEIETDLAGRELQPLEVLARGVVQGPVIDLLQGDYSRSEEWGRLLWPWRTTAALLAAGLVLGGVSAGLDYYQLSREQVRLAADIEAAYRETFPQARRIVNPRAQMEQKLKALQHLAGGGGRTPFLRLLGDVGRVLKKTGGIRIEGATFRDGRLDLQLVADNVQILDRLKQSLASEAKLAAEIQSATTGKDGKVSSRVRIEGGGA